MDRQSLETRISWALEAAADQGFITPYTGSAELFNSRYEILEFEFSEDEIEDIPESTILEVFQTWAK